MNQKGFTLIEIIAVIVIIAIVSAIAVPRYLAVQQEARLSAAHAAIAEVKAQAAQYYMMKLLRDSYPAHINEIVASVGPVPSVGNDFNVSFQASGSNGMITVSQVKGVSLSSNVVGTWYYPKP